MGRKKYKTNLFYHIRPVILFFVYVLTNAWLYCPWVPCGPLKSPEVLVL